MSPEREGLQNSGEPIGARGMGIYIETGIGRAASGKDVEMGRKAASVALGKLTRFGPTLAIAFVSADLDVGEIAAGIRDILGDCPIIGTSTAGEIADGYQTGSVVVSVVASPHLRVQVGVGKGVSSDYRKAVRQGLSGAHVSEYFNAEHPLHQMLRVPTSRSEGVSPAFLVAFSPGAVTGQVSFGHDIHTELRKASANRIPIFGGTSADSFRFEANYQICNGYAYSDSVVLAFVETEILFGLGMAHGFSPTSGRALVTKASGHIVHELDNRPAIDVWLELLDMPKKALGDGTTLFSRFPFGTVDVYGNSVLCVPQRVLPDGSMTFGSLMRNDLVLTVMHATMEDVIEAGVSAYDKALKQGGLKRPAAALMCSCGLRKRLMGPDEPKEMAIIRRKTRIPLSGFYAYGEHCMSDDGLPVYANQSVSMLVFSDELNPVSALLYKGKRIYQEFSARLSKKETQMKVMGTIGQLIQKESNAERLLTLLSEKLNALFPWANWQFYLPSGVSRTFSAVLGRNGNGFPPEINDRDIDPTYTAIGLDGSSRRFGLLLFEKKSGTTPEDEEDMALVKTVGRLTAKGLQRIELDNRLTDKLVQLEILNHLSYEISRSIAANSKLRHIVSHIRRILKLSRVTLWFADEGDQWLEKAATDEDSQSRLSGTQGESDVRLARWQMATRRPVSPVDDPPEIALPTGLGCISLPLEYKGQIKGVLNLFWRTDRNNSFEFGRMGGSMEFLAGIANQLAIFIENRYLQKHTTFLKEIHHRVKNNLQNVASILRLQVRRLDGVSAEQALNDSISRIMSIALVHETLGQEEIGMVDLRGLLRNVCELALSGRLEPSIAIDISGTSVMIPSREATSLALVVNELIQNAVRHAYKGRSEGRLSIVLEHRAKNVSVTIEDEGGALPDHFNPEKDGNLGLTIVRTLVTDDLRGRFTLKGGKQTTARVVFPLPKNYYEPRP